MSYVTASTYSLFTSRIIKQRSLHPPSPLHLCYEPRGITTPYKIIKQWCLPPPSPLHPCSEPWGITTPYKNICFGLKLKNGQLTLLGPLFGGALLRPHSSFFGPGEIAQRLPQRVGRLQLTHVICQFYYNANYFF